MAKNERIEIPMTLEVLEKSRKKPKVGDIFVVKPKGFDYYYGAVVRTDAVLGVFKNCILIYIYNISKKEIYPMPELKKESLLIPPKFTNRLPWSRGYFKMVGHKADLDVYNPHAFLNLHPFSKDEGDYCNEFGEPIKKTDKVFKCNGLSSFASIDAWIIEALKNPKKIVPSM